MQTPDPHKDFWDHRYQSQQMGWDLGMPSPPLQAYFDQLTNKDIRILMPGAGNAYEAAYLYQQGFEQVYVLDISPLPLAAFAERFPDFPQDQLIEGDFFKHEGQYDLMVEQTFFCTFSPTAENRGLYAQKAASLLKAGGKLVGLWFDFALTTSGPPYGGSKAEYLPYFEPHFDILSFDRANNSVASRQGNELFGIMRR